MKSQKFASFGDAGNHRRTAVCFVGTAVLPDTVKTADARRTAVCLFGMAV